MCTSSATVLHLSGGTWEAVPLRGVSLHARTLAGAESGGRTRTHEVRLRIPASVCPPVLPEPGDLLVPGLCEAPKTRAALRGTEAYTVQAVTDNRRGGLAHVAVTAV